jgi:thymidine kinase
MKKKVIFSIFISAALMMATVSFNACTKQENDVQALNRKIQQPEPTREDVAIFNKIKDFKKKVEYIRENPMYKSGEMMSIDEAKFYLDATFNLTYAFTAESFNAFNTGTFFIVINKTDGEVSLDDVSAAFYDMKDKTVLLHNATIGQDKELYISHMEITSNTADEVVMKTTATIGAKTGSEPPEPNEWGPYTVGDDWMYGETLGDCDGNWEDDKDAATEIMWATNYYRYKYITDAGEGWYAYYTDPSALITDVTVYQDATNEQLFRNPNDVMDNDRDYYLLYQKKDEANNLYVHTCIPWDEMNFYYNGTRKVIYEIIQENPGVFGVGPNLTFMNCESIEGLHEGGPDDDPNIPYHTMDVLYKTKHIIAQNINPIHIN